MATTNSTDKQLNYYYVDSTETNSNVGEYIYTNTGNEKRKNGLTVLNDTYTCSGTGDVIINAKLLNYSDAIIKRGDEIPGANGILEDDKEYQIIGHPDKWVYDYLQEYNNCGVDSSLNILSQAGKVDIIQKDTEYQNYLNKPTVTTEYKAVYDPETNSYNMEKVTTTTYPIAKTNTEDSFLLWAVQNSHNDEKWYDEKYTNIGDVDLPTGVEINDFCIHSKNDYEYKTVEDLKGHPKEIGGTTVLHRDNILEYYGVKSEYEAINVKKVAEVGSEITKKSEPVVEDDGDGVKVTTITTVTSKDYKTVTTTTEVVHYSDKDQKEKTYTEKTVTVENRLNAEWYNYINRLEELIVDGRGVILSGYATENYEGEPDEGESHAITLLGVVKGKVVKTETNVYIDDKLQGDSSTSEEALDVVGFYVMDTGGWLGYNEGAVFITPKQLYNFLTNSNYVGAPEIIEYTGKYINYTSENIKNWAFEMNLVGNNRKNILKGNDSKNVINAGKGNDVIYGNAGNDTIYGEGDKDTLIGGAGDDLLNGGTGDDTYIFKASDKSNNDTIIYGGGKDKIQFDNTIVEFQDAEGNITGYERHTIQPIMDVIDPTTGDVVEAGMKYQNILGDLVIEYTSKIEKLDTDGNLIAGETQTFTNTLTIKDYFKKAQYTSIKFITEASGAYIDGQDIDYTGFVYKSYNFFEDFISNKGYIDYYAYAEKENKITGSKYRDSIVGGNKNDSISSAAANDIINGGYGNDTIKAGAGDDEIYASYGNDSIYGDAGNDKFYYNSTTGTFGGDDTICSGSGTDYIYMEDKTLSDLTFTKQGNNLVIYYNTNGDSITIASYFSKKGNTSIKGIELSGGVTYSLYHKYSDILAAAESEANKSQVINDSKNTTGNTLNGGIAHDKITAGKGNDVINGNAGFDTLYGGNGNDTLVGGSDSDKLYGQAGDNTYQFALGDGHDTIYTTGKGQTILDFSGTGLTFDTTKSSGSYITHSYTKVKNDLLINYAQSNVQDGNATVQISNYFSSGNNFTIKWGDAEGQSLNLKDVYIYMNGDDTKKNTITGSKYNDSIVGYEFDDVLKGGAGNDIIIGGKGNDKITGGTSNTTGGGNIIEYKNGDGYDTIYLSKNENLTINVSDYTKNDKLAYRIEKSDLIVSVITIDEITNEVTNATDILNLKNFGTRDVTTDKGSVNLNFTTTEGTETIDLREDSYFNTYSSFTAKKYSYTGNWHTEIIDGRTLNRETELTRGVKVNAGAGHDTIYGSVYNDTINGGNGNDVIYTDFGKNTVNGGNGNDVYHIFDFQNDDYIINETTTIKDSGKTYEKSGEIDTVIIDSKINEVLYDTGNPDTAGSIWFNITNKGKATYTLNIKDDHGNTAKVTGVEKVVVTNGSTNSSDYKQFNFYNNNQLIQEVVGWLTTYGYKDVNTAITKGDPQDVKGLLAIFADSNHWGAVTETL